jgi:asparagine synthase (glutamine-hydrolysing)
VFRYMAFSWDAAKPAQTHIDVQVLHQRLLRLPGRWERVLSADGLWVFCTRDRNAPATHNVLTPQAGVIVGTLFKRCTPSATAPAVFSASETRAILDSRGARLIESYWGRYVAFLVDSATKRRWVLKDPTGRMPCFRTDYQGIAIVFSSLHDFERLNLRALAICWPYIDRRVAVGSGRWGQTALQGIEEVLGGERIEYHEGSMKSTLLWQPQRIVASESLEDADQAAEALRSVLLDCTRAWLRGHEHIVHRLSGGLDSSIVMGCLKQLADSRSITCVTYFDPEGSSDERPWARRATQGARCEHLELARDPRLRFDNLLTMCPLPYPPQDISFLEFGALDRGIAAERSVTAIFTGDGGDTLFGSHTYRFAAADYLHRHGVDGTLLKVALNVAASEDTSLWHVLLRAVRGERREWDGFTASQLLQARRLVCPHRFAWAVEQEQGDCHPWFTSGRCSLSVQAALTPVIASDLYYDPLLPPEVHAPELICPVLSQPVVELCLRIPSFVHFEDGIDRGLARRAFAADVPAEILARQWKDRVQGFPEKTLMHGQTFIRDFLIGGRLVKQGLLDSQLIEQALTSQHAKHTVSIGEILDHVMVEAWLRGQTCSYPVHHHR